MNTFKKYQEFLLEEEKKPRVGHTVKRGYYDDDPPDIGLYSKGGRDAIKGTGYANKEKAEFTIKELDKLMDKGERVWAMSIATTMESRAKKHQHQTDGMREAMKIFRKWIDANKKSESVTEEKGKTLFHPGEGDAVQGTGYKDEKAANDTIKIIDKLKKTDHRHAMSIATTMMNRAKTHKYPTPDMKKAADIFAKWIDDNRKTESTFHGYEDFLLEFKMPSMKWVDFDLNKVDDEGMELIWKMYSDTYSQAGMDFSASDYREIRSKYKATFLKDVDKDKLPDAFIIYKETPYGNKIALLGTNGIKDAKKDIVKKILELVNTRGWYIEASLRMEELLSSAKAPVVTNEKAIKDIVGADKKPEMQKDGYYTRLLSKANKRIIKRIYGILR